MLGLRRKSKVSSSEGALAEARTTLQQSLARLDAIRAQYETAVSADDRDSALAARKDEGDATVERDLAQAKVVRLEKELSDARAAEAEAERRMKYEAAKTARDAAAKRLRDDYPRLARDLAGLLAEVDASDAALLAANSDKPTDEPDLLPAESIVRDRAGSPEKILKRERVEEWTYRDSGQRVGDARGYQLPLSGEIGVLVPPGGGRTIPVAKRPFDRVTYFPATPHRFADPLGATVRLPGLIAGDPSIYPPDPSARDNAAEPVPETRFEPNLSPQT